MLKRLAAEIGIRRLHALSADAVSRRDAEAFGNCFTEDGEWKIGGLHLCGRAEIVSALKEFRSVNERVMVTFGSPILEVANGTASGRTHAIEHTKRLDGAASRGIGIYYERFVEQDGDWLFQWRHFEHCYLGPPDLSAPIADFRDYGAPPAMPRDDDPTAFWTSA